MGLSGSVIKPQILITFQERRQRLWQKTQGDEPG